MRKLIFAGLGAFAMRWVQKRMRGKANDRAALDAATAQPLRHTPGDDRRVASKGRYIGVERRSRST